MPKKRKHEKPSNLPFNKKQTFTSRVNSSVNENNEIDNRVLSSDSSDDEREEGGREVGGIWIPPALIPACSTESTCARLLITKIVIENFKSYFGRVVIGPFGKSFNAIIGPNGSGKSNVIDSMLFVFGYRSTKIRCKKISVLIHKSEQHRNVQSCTVEVHFVNINDTEGLNFDIVPESKFVVSRTANIDNSSFYTVNGRRKTFKEISTLLRSKGIDLKHNRFLILQGEVEQISLMKPKAQSEHETGMLEYLEDIIGTSRYKKPLEKLTKKVDILNEERRESLKKHKNAVKERDSLADVYGSVLVNLGHVNSDLITVYVSISKEMFQYEDVIERKETSARKIQDELSSKYKERAQLISKQSKYQEIIKKTTDELIQQCKVKEKYKYDFKNMECRLTQLNEEIENTDKRKSSKSKLKLELIQKISELEELPEVNTEKIEKLKHVENNLKADKVNEEKELDEALASIENDTKELRQQQASMETESVELKNKLTEAESALKLKKTSLEIYLKKEETAKRNLEEAVALYTRSEEQLKQELIKQTTYEKKLSDSERSSTLENAKKNLEETNKELQVAVLELSKKRSQLQDINSNAEKSSSNNRCLTFLMKEQSEGRLHGIYGRVGDLGGINSMYDVAVSTAGAGGLDTILADSKEACVAALTSLKVNNVGRCNLFDLTKIQCKHQYSQPFTPPGPVSRIFDLIKVEDEKFKDAFYYIFRDTLVARDLDIAKKVSYGGKKRYRVVTLTGELIEPSGVMCGGGNRVISGKMGRKAVNVQPDSQLISRVTRDIASLESKVNSARSLKNSLEETIHTISTEINNIQTEFNKVEMTTSRLKALLPDLKKSVEKKQEEVNDCATDPNEIQQQNGQIEGLQKNFDKCSTAFKKVDDKVKKIKDEIKSLREGRTKVAKDRITKITTELSAITEEINTLTIQLKTSHKQLREAQKKLINITKELEDYDNNLIKFDKEKESLTSNVEDYQEKLQEMNREIKNLEKSLKQHKVDIDDMAERISNLNSSSMKSDNQLKTIQNEIADENEKRNERLTLRNHINLFVAPSNTEKKAVIPEGDELRKMAKDATVDSAFTLAYIRQLNNDGETYLNTLNEYNRLNGIVNERTEELTRVSERRDFMKKNLEDVSKARLTEFLTGFTIITNKLKEMYQMLTKGGNAEFELVDKLDPFADGIELTVRPPGKSWKIISNLSGGEKTLTSLALVFALHYYRPSPLYVMDEIDAALDYRNVYIVGRYVLEQTKNAQFLIISLRSNMFEQAQTLVGIYKTYNCTQSTTITPALYKSTSLYDNEENRENDSC